MWIDYKKEQTPKAREKRSNAEYTVIRERSIIVKKSLIGKRKGKEERKQC